jgi:signal transduction histidine kinase
VLFITLTAYNLLLTFYYKQILGLTLKYGLIVLLELIAAVIALSFTFQQSPVSPFLMYSLTSIISLSYIYGYRGAFASSFTLSMIVVPIFFEEFFIALIYVLSFNLFAYVFATYSYMVKQHKLLNDHLTKQYNRVKNLNHLLVGSERKRIAREMHDGLLQSLFFINSEVSVCRSLLKKSILSFEVKEMMDEKLQSVQQMAIESLRETRTYIYNLRQDKISGNNFHDELHKIIRQFEKRYPIHVKLKIRGEIDHIGPHLMETLLMICKETLQNIGKHSQSSQAIIELEVAQQLLLTVEDQGIGMDPQRVVGHDQQSNSFGLLGLKERVQSNQGTMEIISSKGNGTKIRFQIPLTITNLIMEG